LWIKEKRKDKYMQKIPFLCTVLILLALIIGGVQATKIEDSITNFAGYDIGIGNGSQENIILNYGNGVLYFRSNIDYGVAGDAFFMKSIIYPEFGASLSHYLEINPNVSVVTIAPYTTGSNYGQTTGYYVVVR